MAVFSLLTNKSYQGNMKRSFRILNECTIYFIIKFTERIVKSAFNPIAAFFLALMVNARHLFYGLSMLEKYKNTGWKKNTLLSIAGGTILYMALVQMVFETIQL